MFNKFKVDDKNDLSSDNIYIDAEIRNVGDQRYVAAIYDQQRIESFVDNPSDYYLSVVRFSIPAFGFPLHIMPIQTGLGVNDSQYSITLDINNGANLVREFLIYEPRTADAQPTTSNPVQFTPYYWIFEYQHMIDMINDALSRAFASLVGTPAGSVAPFMIFNPETKLFSIVADGTFYQITDTLPSPFIYPIGYNPILRYTSPVRIWFNYKLYELFNGIASFFAEATPQADGRDVQILVNNQNNNNVYINPNSAVPVPTTALEMKQQLISVATWNPVKQIIFTSGLLPINSEFTATSDNSFQKILTDFEPLNSSGQDVRTILQFFPQGPYRLIDCIGTNPLYRLDFNIKWKDAYGNLYDVVIPFLHLISVKFLFVKRSLYKNKNLTYK